MIYLYAVAVVICLITFIWTNWYVGADLTIGMFTAMILTSLIPILNVLATIAFVFHAFEQYNGGVLLKGRTKR